MENNVLLTNFSLIGLKEKEKKEKWENPTHNPSVSILSFLLLGSDFLKESEEFESLQIKIKKKRQTSIIYVVSHI